MTGTDDKRGRWPFKIISGISYWYDPKVEERLPEPFSIEGDVENGQPLVVRGGGGIFGNKPSSSLIYEDFNDYSTNSLLKDENPLWISYQDRDGALITEDISRTGISKAAYNSSDRHEFNTNYLSIPETEEVFLSYWMYFDANVGQPEGDYAVGKLCRISSSSAAGGGGVYNGAGVIALSNMNPRTNGSPYLLHDTGGAEGQIPLESNAGSLHVPFNEWVRVNMYSKLNTLGERDGKIVVESVGHQRLILNNRILRAPSVDLKYDTILLGLMMANVIGGPMRMLIDEVYVSYGENSSYRFEIIEGSEWLESNRKREVQPHTEWSPNEVVLSQNHGSLSGNCSLWFVPSDLPAVKISDIYIGDQ